MHCRLGLCVGKNVVIQYISQYKGYNMIYCDILQYCKQGDTLLFFSCNFRKTVKVTRIQRDAYRIWVKKLGVQQYINVSMHWFIFLRFSYIDR